MTADPTTLRDIASRPQCLAIIYVRDTYRRVGGKQRFRMYYVRQQCSRRATAAFYCWQHKAAADRATP